MTPLWAGTVSKPAAAAAVVLSTCASLLAAHFYTQQAQQRDYTNALTECVRINDTLRAPLSIWMAAYTADEALETDDPQLVVASRLATEAIQPVDCGDVVRP